MMLRAFRNFIEKEKLFEPGQRVLLAVSGGLDSMAMVCLFQKARFRYGIAHCNFQLRGADSEEDELFVRSVAANSAVPFYSRKFSTARYA